MAHGEALRIRVIKVVVEDGFCGTRRPVRIASAIRWVKAFEETQRTAALPTGADRRSVLKPHRDWLLELRRKQNHLTLDAIPSDCFAGTASKPTSRCCRASLPVRASASKAPCAPANRIPSTSLSASKRGGARKAALAVGSSSSTRPGRRRRMRRRRLGRCRHTCLEPCAARTLEDDDVPCASAFASVSRSFCTVLSASVTASF